MYGVGLQTTEDLSFPKGQVSKMTYFVLTLTGLIRP